MANTPVTGSVQQSGLQAFQQDPYKTAPLKRAKKEPGALTGKSVVVLKPCDVVERDGTVFMPNTIEMARLKKSEKGQFKTNVQISSKMTVKDIKQIIEQSFPFLANKRFYCAGAADNRTRLDFHGERRIWDGKFLKQKIKGNSALYIYADEASFGKQDPTTSLKLPLKRSHDQMTTMNNDNGTETAGWTMTQGSFGSPLGGMAQDTICIASNSQTGEHVSHATDRDAATRNTLLLLYPPGPHSHSDLQEMVSQSLTPEMDSLNIANTASGRERDRFSQTAAGGNIFTNVSLGAVENQGEGNGSESIAGVPFHPLKKSSFGNAAEKNCVRTKDINGSNEVVGTSESENESQLSDSAVDWSTDPESQSSDLTVDRSTDSGIEANDAFCVIDGSLENSLKSVLSGLPHQTESEKDWSLDVYPPTSSQMINASRIDSTLEDICCAAIPDNISDKGLDRLGVVGDICPRSGPLKGEIEFYISLTKELPDEVKDGVARFEGVDDVNVDKLNSFTLRGTVPPYHLPGEVKVTVETEFGEELGVTLFTYIDEMRVMVQQLVKNPILQSFFFDMWSQEAGCLATGNTVTQVLGPLNVSDQDSSFQSKQLQSLKVLQLLVYTAAKTDARQFIEMIFSTSAGQIVFNSYKDRTPLPEDVARANGHEELAQYLLDVHARLSKDEDVQVNTIDWLELVEAVQKQSLRTLDESTIRLDQYGEDDDDSKNYFADAETSSCAGSFEEYTGLSGIAENEETCTDDGPIPVPESLDMTSDAQINREEDNFNFTSMSSEYQCFQCLSPTKGEGTAFSAINTPTALHETEESPAKRDHVKRGAYKEGPTVGPWFGLGWFHLAIVLILVLVIIILVILILPGTTLLSAETSTTNCPSQHRWNRASCIPCVECPRRYVTSMCESKQETDCLECWLGYDYSNSTVTKCCMARSGCADGIYVDYCTENPLCTTRKWSTKILSVQSAAVLTVNTSSGTCPYETKESPGEPSLSQKDASHKKPIQQISGFFLGILAALVTTVVAVQWYKKRKRLCQSNDNDAQRSIPELQRGLDTLIRDLTDEDRAFIASWLDNKDPDGFYNWEKVAEKLGLVRDQWRVNPTEKLNLLSAFAERKDSTIRKLIEASQEAGLPLLASELDKRFLRGVDTCEVGERFVGAGAFV